ncbi:DUF2922 domain-containing protein [Bacillus mesophilum]|uniref:DUF2922 domain-containing protein n=1 Tax=Bacillus mesophilum TaxID=1071718 RepID=A0A7V7RQ82_9BACI|nr:DUF2922 domain-containing protein [Bacillus mesophilum]KAB2335549.1 DUF2922 domain-containing protein [Bacillus mesophilum]
MEKTLELTFLTNLDKQARISIDQPKEPIDPDAVKAAMEQMISSDVFQGSNGSYAAVKEARLVERTVTSYEFV